MGVCLVKEKQNQVNSYHNLKSIIIFIILDNEQFST